MKLKSKYIFFMFIILVVAGCGKQEEEAAKPLRRVSYTTTQISGSNIQKIFPGTVQGATEANISFRVPGNLMTKYVGLGAKVEKGEVIAILDPTDYQINLSEAKAKLAEARANVTRSSSDFRRYRELFLNDNASKAEYDNAKATYEASLANLKATDERANFAKLQLSYTKLVAPYSGTVSIELADESENLAAGSPVFTLVKEEESEVQLFIPEDYTKDVYLGMDVNIRIDALKGKNFKGKIKEVGSGITGVGNTFPVKVSIEDASSFVKTGMTAQVLIGVKNQHAGAIIVPLSSVIEDGNNKTYVYTVDPQGENAVLTKREVQLGNLYGNSIEIKSGLEPNEKIVDAGVNYIYDGQEVRALPNK